jgi:hypothetical protein
MNHSALQRTLFLIPVLVLAIAPIGRAECREGCLPNQNTVLGEDALLSNTTGTGNTGIGFNSIFASTEGINNTAVGGSSLFSNTTGFDNTAIGYQALPANTTGYINIAIGSYAVQDNTTGVQNTAIGGLSSNTTGSYNTATGSGALAYNTGASFNTALGYNALLHNVTGVNNIGLGAAAGSNLDTGSDNIDIGDEGHHGEANTIRIGKRGTQTATFIAGISGATVPTGVTVVIDATGHLGTTTSSARFKEEIKPMDKSSEAVLALKPVTFHYKRELDPTCAPQFGLLAEEVAKVDPDLVARDEQGKPYTVRYDAVNAMLLNEFLKERQTVQELKREVTELTAGLHRVNAKLSVGKSSSAMGLQHSVK